jgi:[ribosomal protein S5]-alanine N-acetyltransferase
MHIKTDRLELHPMAMSYAAMMQQLTNTAGWLRNVGDRKTTTPEGLEAYMQKVLASGNPHYVIVVADSYTPIGIVSFMQRPELQYPDIGYALLNEYIGNGYAIEATKAVLAQQIKAQQLQTVLAEVLPDNAASISLLQKIGFVYSSDIMDGQALLHVYTLDATAFVQAQDFLQAVAPKKPADPLHGKTLEKVITDLVENMGWEAMADKIAINCFIANPSVKSSLTFLRKTPWARKRVEELWLARIGWQL